MMKNDKNGKNEKNEKKGKNGKNEKKIRENCNFPKNEKLQISSSFFHFFLIFLSFLSLFIILYQFSSIPPLEAKMVKKMIK